MKLAAMWIVANLVSLGCLAGAIICAVNLVSGWGWFLLCALLMASTYEGKEGQ